MASINFTYNGISTTIQCNKDEKMRDIFDKFVSKTNLDINKIQFLYGGNIINNSSELTFIEQANSNDKERNIMNILVYKIDNTLKNENNSLIESKYIICPKCQENCRFKINEFYKIDLYECKNEHKIENIPLDQFYNSQKINESLILCNNCNKNNKSITHEKLFYICLECKQNLCPLCNSIHNKNHNIIDYNKKNYICNIHNDTFISYCNDCKNNLCILCEEKHIKHKITSYREILCNRNEIKEKINKFKKKVDNLREKINNIIEILNEVYNKIEMIYKINYNIINNFEIQNKNYEILQNLNEINNIETNEINNIINENDINNQFINILKIYNKIKEGKNINLSKNQIINEYDKNNNNENNIIIMDKNIKNVDNINKELNDEIIIRYKINEKDDKIRLFGKKFVDNNKNICKIIYKEKIYELTEHFHKSIYDIKEDILEIKLKGINQITNLSCMFDYCENLISLPNISKLDTSKFTDMSSIFSICQSLIPLPDISKWDTSNVTNMSSMFSNCYYLSSIPDISNWKVDNVIDMGHLSSFCRNINYLPDISNWNTKNVTRMERMFGDCRSLKSLPDISKWNTSKVTNMEEMFENCKSLSSLPNINKWDISNATNKESMFSG